MRVARIAGTGMAVPEKVLSNADLERLVDTSDEWITSRTGIKERRIASAEESLVSFAGPAAERALADAGIEGADVDLVICATVTPDTTFPSTSTRIQEQIGAGQAPAFDIAAACTGFIYGIAIAQQFIENETADTVLVVGGEILSKLVDWSDRATCVLFGDGAGAIVLRAVDTDQEESGRVLRVALHSDGSFKDLIQRPGGGSMKPPSSALYQSGDNFIKMRGNETFKVAVRSLAEVSEEVLASCGHAPADVDWFIPHQANLRIIEAVGQRLAVPAGHTYVNIERYGNTSAASIPIALDELNR